MCNQPTKSDLPLKPPYWPPISQRIDSTSVVKSPGPGLGTYSCTQWKMFSSLWKNVSACERRGRLCGLKSRSPPAHSQFRSTAKLKQEIYFRDSWKLKTRDQCQDLDDEVKAIPNSETAGSYCTVTCRLVGGAGVDDVPDADFSANIIPVAPLVAAGPTAKSKCTVPVLAS